VVTSRGVVIGAGIGGLPVLDWRPPPYLTWQSRLIAARRQRGTQRAEARERKEVGRRWPILIVRLPFPQLASAALAKTAASGPARS